MKTLIEKFPHKETMKRVLSNLGQSERLKKPLIAAYYVNFSCNANCNFCSQGQFTNGDNKGQYKEEVNLDKQIEVLRTIRKDVPNINLLGGEPTVNANLDRILQECSELDFETISISTNALSYSPAILDHADLIVPSLHSLSPEKLGGIYQIPPERAQKAIENIKRYSIERDKKKTQMVANCVINGNNIEDVYEVVQLCQELGIKLSVTPSIQSDGMVDEELVENPDYIKLIEWLKTQDAVISSSQEGLDIIQKFKPFICTPNIIPGIHPNGDLVSPCQYAKGGPEMVNVFEAGGVNKALLLGRQRYEKKNGVLDTRNGCADICHKTCYVEGAQLNSLRGIMKRVSSTLKALGS